MGQVILLVEMIKAVMYMLQCGQTHSSGLDLVWLKLEKLGDTCFAMFGARGKKEIAKNATNQITGEFDYLIY